MAKTTHPISKGCLNNKNQKRLKYLRGVGLKGHTYTLYQMLYKYTEIQNVIYLSKMLPLEDFTRSFGPFCLGTCALKHLQASQQTRVYDNYQTSHI